MAKYISIPTTITAFPELVFNTDAINTILYASATTVIIFAHGRSYTITTSAAGAAGLLAAINVATLNQAGPLLVPVVLPAGVTISAIPTVVAS
jgi:hypothetical protein